MANNIGLFPQRGRCFLGWLRPFHFPWRHRSLSVKRGGRDHGHPSADAPRFGQSLRERKVQLPVPDAAKILGYPCWALADESQSDSHPDPQP